MQLPAAGGSAGELRATERKIPSYVNPRLCLRYGKGAEEHAGNDCKGDSMFHVVLSMARLNCVPPWECRNITILAYLELTLPPKSGNAGYKGIGGDISLSSPAARKYKTWSAT